METVNEQFDRPVFVYDEATRKLVTDVWDKFRLMWQIRTMPLEILGGRTLQNFWDDSNKDYGVYVEPSMPNDPVTQYASTISRDRSDVFISHLTKQLMFPSVSAQNQEQEIDRVLGRVSLALLEWAHNNDGYPSENGHQKMTRYVHKMVVEGTVHVQDDVDKDGLLSTLVPNEEVFVPNYWQPDLQRQGRLCRAQLNVTYSEAEELYGHLENFKYVVPGFADWWFYQRPVFKQQWQGVLMYDRVQVLHYWQNCTGAEIKDLISKGRLPKGTKCAKWYNLFINEIPMFPVDTLCPYKDGLYPLSKGIFTEHAKAEFYWGNSLPNKVQQDKLWLDGWKTLLRYKAKLNIGRPLQSLNGQFVDEEVIVPFKITPVTEEIELKPIEGVGEPISNADVQMYEMAKGEVEAQSLAPQTEIAPTQKVTNAVMMENNAKVMMDAFALKVAFLIQSRTFPILMRLFQFIPRKSLEKICVPDQVLENGARGTMQVKFEKIPKMTAWEKLMKSKDLMEYEDEKKKEGENMESIVIDPEYIRNCNFYLKTDPDSVTSNKGELEKQRFNNLFPQLIANPTIFNPKEVARELVIKNDLPESLINDQEQPTGGMPGMPGMPGQAPGQAPAGAQGEMPPTPQPPMQGLPQMI